MSSERTVRWRCLNPLCDWSAVATITLAGEQPAPRCVCGSTTQEIEHTPATYLDFLRGEPFHASASVPEEE